MEHICKDVTHAFFTSYIHDDDFKKLREKNVPLFKNFIDVIDAVCPKLERVCLQTGGKVCDIVRVNEVVGYLLTKRVYSTTESTWDPSRSQ